MNAVLLAYIIITTIMSVRPTVHAALVTLQQFITIIALEVQSVCC